MFVPALDEKLSPSLVPYLFHISLPSLPFTHPQTCRLPSPLLDRRHNLCSRHHDNPPPVFAVADLQHSHPAFAVISITSVRPLFLAAVLIFHAFAVGFQLFTLRVYFLPDVLWLFIPSLVLLLLFRYFKVSNRGTPIFTSCCYGTTKS